jgi:putative transposase
MPPPCRKTENLHHGRTSQPGASYFITVCLSPRRPLLHTEVLTTTILDVCEQLGRDGDVENICGTVMPDHVHWIFVLGSRLSLGRILAKWKSSLPLTTRIPNTAWQRDFFEHRLRPVESIESYGLYCFLNPYRAGLIPHDRSWPGWRLWKPDLFQFVGLLRNGCCPEPEWFDAVETWKHSMSWFSCEGHGED